MSVSAGSFYISTLSGLVIQLPYSPTLTIAQIRPQVASCLGCPTSIQVYSYDGMELNDEDYLGLLGVKEKDKVFVLMRNPVLRQVFMHVSGHMYTVDAVEDQTVKSLLEVLARESNQELTNVRVYRQGTLIKDVNNTLRAEGITHMEVLHVRFAR